MRDTTLYLIRHAESAPDFSIAESEWPLSANGSDQAQRLATRLRELAPTRLVSSPYRRAIDTLAPFSRDVQLPVQLEADLRERHLRDGRVDNWDEMMQTLWADLDARMPNCESGTECRRRVTLRLTALANTAPGETILASSHGNAIALFLNGIDATFGHDAWKRMRSTQTFRVYLRNRRWDWDTRYTLDATDP